MFLDAGAVGAEIVEYRGQSGRVVEPVEHRTHPGVDGGDGGVVVAQLAGAAFLPAVGSGALHVSEGDVEDVDHIVAGAAGERVGVGGQCGDPPGRAEVGQLGGPGLVGVGASATTRAAGIPERSRPPAPIEDPIERAIRLASCGTLDTPIPSGSDQDQLASTWIAERWGLARLNPAVP